MISLITCIYNQTSELFAECALSVATQNVPLEWIIVDDCSDESFVEMYRRTVAESGLLPHAKIVRCCERSGLAKARNQALNEASGDWVVVLDSDDCLVENCLLMLEKQPSSCLVACFGVEFFS